MEDVLDKVRFRSVCKLWRSFLSFPASVTPTSIPSPLCFETHCVVKEKTVYRVHHEIPSLFRGNQFLVVLERIHHDNFTVNKLKFRIHPFFSAHHEVNLRNKLNTVNNGRLSWLPISKFHHTSRSFAPEELKVVVINDIKVALLDRELTGKLAVVCGDALQWKNIECTSKLDDIVEYKGKFFAVDRHGGGFILDCNTFEMSKIVEPVQTRKNIYETERRGYELVLKRKRLVMDDENGVLYLLVAWNSNQYRPTSRIKVYELKEDDLVRVE